MSVFCYYFVIEFLILNLHVKILQLAKEYIQVQTEMAVILQKK